MERVGEKSKRSRILLIGSISYLLTVQMTILFDKLPCSVHKTGVFSCYIFWNSRKESGQSRWNGNGKSRWKKQTITNSIIKIPIKKSDQKETKKETWDCNWVWRKMGTWQVPGNFKQPRKAGTFSSIWITLESNSEWEIKGKRSKIRLIWIKVQLNKYETAPHFSIKSKLDMQLFVGFCVLPRFYLHLLDLNLKLFCFDVQNNFRFRSGKFR